MIRRVLKNAQNIITNGKDEKQANHQTIIIEKLNKTSRVLVRFSQRKQQRVQIKYINEQNLINFIIKQLANNSKHNHFTPSCSPSSAHLLLHPHYDLVL